MDLATARDIMLTRRAFLHGSAATITGATVTLVLTDLGCSSDDGGRTTSTSPTLACDGIGSVSSETGGHRHEVCVRDSDLASPPSSGVTITTSVSDGHTHTLVLAQAQLQALAAGSAVTLSTRVAEDHTHSVSLQRAPAATLPPPTGGGGSSSGYVY